MSGAVKVPDPVKERIDREAEERGIPRGSVVEGWMRDADRLEEIQRNFEEHFD